MWVPPHIKGKGNEEADKQAKESLKDLVLLSKAEIKGLSGVKMEKKWQNIWDTGRTMRHLYNIHRNVGMVRKTDRKREVIMTRLRIGHTTMNKILFIIEKHEPGN